MVRNYTPFRPLVFNALDVAGEEYGVFVLRGTFTIMPDIAVRPAPMQEPIVEADRWHGEPGKSSLYMDSDLAPFKPRSDIHVNAVAHAPGWRPLTDWLVTLRVGELRKTLRVTGPRRWVRRENDWTLTEPEPVREVPIRYELAFGGTWTTPWRKTYRFEENPVGVGYVGEEVPAFVESVPAPQIVAPDDAALELGKVYRVEGLGPIARSWASRLCLAGTFDEVFRTQRWPNLPSDFDYAYYSSAHPDLRTDVPLRGDEEVVLDGVTPNGGLRFYLPGYQLALLFRLMDGTMACGALMLDTLIIDLPANRVHMTWRSNFGTQYPIRVIEARMKQPRRE
jgi:hypothetical protein